MRISTSVGTPQYITLYTFTRFVRDEKYYIYNNKLNVIM